jgi:integrase/recombinase XerD
MQLDRAIDYFLAAKDAEGLSAQTTKTYAQHLYRFARNMLEVGEAEDIDKFTVTGYIAKMQADEHMKPVSVNTQTRSLRVFCKWLEDEGLINVSPFRAAKNPVKMPRFEKRPIDIISDDDFRALLRSCDDRSSARDRRDTAILMFLFDTGVRVGELVALKKDDLDMKARKARVVGKGRKWRTVFFSPQTAVALQRHLQRLQARDKQSPLVFCGWAGRQFSTYGVNHMIAKRAERAGVKSRVNPHTFRHTFATNYLRMGGDASSLQRILGHSDISTTIRNYAHLVDEDLSKAHDQFSPMARVLSRR